MLSFKNFLVEAEMNADDLSRVISVFERRLPKMLGTMYRYGGSGHVMKMNGYDQIMYFFGDRAFAVRFKGGHVLGVDVWKHYTIDTGPSHSIDVHSLNASSLVTAISKLGALIKNPKEGKYEVDAVNESVQLDEMAKRVSDDAFYQMVQRTFGDQSSSLTWDQIKQVATENDVLIPGYVRGQKVAKGLFDAKPGGNSGSGESADTGAAPEKAKKGAPTLYIKVTAQDPVTKRFIPAGESKEAQALYQQIAGGMSSKPTEKELRDPETLYGHLAQLVEMACKGSLRSLLIYGGPGTGKTYTIMQVIEKTGLRKGIDYVKLSGKASATEIYKTLFMFRKGGMVVFDDLDNMWRNEDATNILKAALDTSPVREISSSTANTINVSKMTDEDREKLFDKIDKQIAGDDVVEDEPDPEPEDDEDDEEGDSPKKKSKKGPKKPSGSGVFNASKLKYPSTFNFTGRVVFISNLKKEEFDTAIMSRTAKINMDLTPEEILQRMRNVLGGLGGDDIPLKKKEELLNHLVHMHGHGEIDQVTMREFVKGLNIVRSGVPNWKELIQYA